MNWYQPIEQRILCWRRWRQSLDTDNIEICAQHIQDFWYSSPWRKNSKLSDQPETWPDPWQLFNTMSYCERMRALGMFYTVSLIPQLRLLNPELHLLYDSVGERFTTVSLDSGRCVLNFSTLTVINNQSIGAEYQLLSRYYPTDFKSLT
jgi:hypothetical protein